MANTTKDESPVQPLPQVDAQGEIEKEAVKRYEKGENLYSIARAIYRFDSEEAVDSIRHILREAGYLNDGHQAPETRLMDE